MKYIVINGKIRHGHAPVGASLPEDKVLCTKCGYHVCSKTGPCAGVEVEPASSEWTYRAYTNRQGRQFDIYVHSSDASNFIRHWIDGRSWAAFLGRKLLKPYPTQDAAMAAIEAAVSSGQR